MAKKSDITDVYPVGNMNRADWLKLVAQNCDTDDCVFWPFAVGKGGYGNLAYRKSHTNAHRLVCEVHNGPPPSSKHQAAHDCGNRKCINPKHISWKTPAENNYDKVRHGTTRRGEKSNLAKLSRADVDRVRALHAKHPNLTYKELANLAGTGRANTWLIATGRTWID